MHNGVTSSTCAILHDRRGSFVLELRTVQSTVRARKTSSACVERIFGVDTLLHRATQHKRGFSSGLRMNYHDDENDVAPPGEQAAIHQVPPSRLKHSDSADGGSARGRR